MTSLKIKTQRLLFVSAIALTVLSADQARAAKVPWRTSLPEAIKESKRTGKPLFVNFSAEWCPPCEVMDRKVFPNAALNAELRRWIPVYIDSDKNEALGEKYKISTMPAFYLMKKNGTIVTKSVGYQNANGLIKWLKANYAKAKR